MSLGLPAQRTTVLTIDGVEFKVRELTAAETYAIKEHVDAGQLDRATQLQIAYATDTPLDEVADWWRAVPSHTAEALSQAINDFMGDDQERTKSGPADVHAGGG